MYYRIEVSTKPSLSDPIGEELKRDAKHFGIEKIQQIRLIRVFILKVKHLNRDALTKIETVLSDPINDVVRTNGHITHSKSNKPIFVEIAYLPGVMDTVALTTIKLFKKIGIKDITDVQTRNRYEITGQLRKNEIDIIVRKLLMNNLIQVWLKDEKKILRKKRTVISTRKNINLLNIKDDGLLEISKKGLLSLNLSEMHSIQSYFRMKGREPTVIELETIAQTWSEHCVHKTFKGEINFEGKLINNLLKETIMKVTKKLNKNYCVSVFKDNAGIIKFNKDYNITFKVETHNHPSALEPYGGAGTGIGGVIRDTMGTGLGAKPIANTDIFCFGPLNYPFKKLPPGVLHPKRIFKGVISGVRDYGNKMGIPTINGTIIFDKSYLYNPVVYCGSVGIIPAALSFKNPKDGDAVIVCGGRTGKDGIHGVTFASKELDESSEETSSGAVQIGNPLTEKILLDALLEARDKNLYNAITDCGGGGLSSAVGEMGKELGVSVHLDKVPLKYSGLRYDEIWISESQERMVISVPPKNIKKIEKVFRKHNLDFAVIGKFEKTGKLKLFYQKKKVGELDMDFLHNGYPTPKKNAKFKKRKFKNPKLPKKFDIVASLLKLLSHPNIASKEVVIRQYDHEVQGMSSLKPMTGKQNDGPSDGAVIKPLRDSKKGIVISCGINPFYGRIDPYWMAASNIEESLRNYIACGGNPQKAALLDNFSWGDVDNPYILGELIRASYGCYDTAIALKVPFISGKDSLNNVFALNGKKKSIISTLLISCIGIIDDVTKIPSTDFKEAGNLIYITGITKKELGGSHYFRLFGKTGSSVPKLDFKLSYKLLKTMHSVITKHLIESIHDCSEGGIGVAISEMAIAGRIGAEIDLGKIVQEKNLRSDELLFSESNSRFLIEISPEKKKQFEKKMKEIPFATIGKTTNNKKLIISKGHKKLAEVELKTLTEHWKGRIKW